MPEVRDVISNMSHEVRAKAEAYAKAKGLSLEDAVAQQLEAELRDDDLESVAGGCGEYIIEGPTPSQEYIREE